MNKADTQTACVQIPIGATLLIVDHDPSVRRALRRMLELERTSVVEAADGEQAIRVIEQDEGQLLDVVLTSLVLPVVSGSELISVLRVCRPALPIVAMSGLADLPPDVPPVPFLCKPFEQEELIGALAPLVLRSQAMRRRARQERADAAERPRTIASDQVARRDLMIALQQVRLKSGPRPAL